MIQRRGFLAGCLAALAAPLALFRKPVAPMAMLLGKKPVESDIELDWIGMTAGKPVTINGVEVDFNPAWYDDYPLYYVLDFEPDPVFPTCPSQDMKSLNELSNRLYAKLAAQTKLV